MNITELLIIAVVAIIVLGPEKLPKTLIEIAKLLKVVKKQINDAKNSIETEIKLSELKEEAQKYKDEIAKANESVRKKLSFEEFDEIKKDLQTSVDEINSSLDSVSKSLDDKVGSNTTQTNEILEQKDEAILENKPLNQAKISENSQDKAQNV